MNRCKEEGVQNEGDEGVQEEGDEGVQKKGDEGMQRSAGGEIYSKKEEEGRADIKN